MTTFKPMYGFPPIYKKPNPKVNKEILESRGFTSTNVASITDILNKKKKENPFANSEESGLESEQMSMLISNKPHQYNKTTYKDQSKK